MTSIRINKKTTNTSRHINDPYAKKNVAVGRSEEEEEEVDKNRAVIIHEHGNGYGYGHDTRCPPNAKYYSSSSTPFYAARGHHMRNPFMSIDSMALRRLNGFGCDRDPKCVVLVVATKIVSKSLTVMDANIPTQLEYLHLKITVTLMEEHWVLMVRLVHLFSGCLVLW